MAKAKPGTINFGPPASATRRSWCTEKLMREAGIQLTHVPFNGSQPVAQALIRNDVQVYSDVLTSALAAHQVRQVPHPGDPPARSGTRWVPNRAVR
jgi:tripartite-type tricarboxylate transporter receptor subunit TctC